MPANEMNVFENLTQKAYIQHTMISLHKIRDELMKFLEFSNEKNDGEWKREIVRVYAFVFENGNTDISYG